MVRHVDLRTMIVDKYSTAANTPAVEECTLPDVEVVSRAAVRKPGWMYATLEAASQTDRSTIVIATSREVAAGIDRIAKQPFHSLTKEGIRPYRRPTALKTEDDKLVVQRSTMCKPTVELPTDGGVNLTWDDTTVRFSSASAIAEHAADLPDGIFFATENDEQDCLNIESTDGSHVETVDTNDILATSYSPVHGWVTPNKVSYRSDITIYYLLRTPNQELRPYQPEWASDDSQEPTANNLLSATFDEFMRQTTVSADDYIERDDLFDRYQRWLPDGVAVSETRLAKHLSHADYETDTVMDNRGRHERLCNRTWRYVQPTHSDRSEEQHRLGWSE